MGARGAGGRLCASAWPAVAFVLVSGPWSGPAWALDRPLSGGLNQAVDAAGLEAERRGYSHAMNSATTSEGPAEEIGRHLAHMARSMRQRPGPDCVISGGEPVVKLVESSRRGMGGRNQQLVLASLELLADDVEGIAILSGGTDGEDGPTDAAGAIVDDDLGAARHDAAERDQQAEESEEGGGPSHEERIGRPHPHLKVRPRLPRAPAGTRRAR